MSPIYSLPSFNSHRDYARLASSFSPSSLPPPPLISSLLSSYFTANLCQHVILPLYNPVYVYLRKHDLFHTTQPLFCVTELTVIFWSHLSVFRYPRLFESGSRQSLQTAFGYQSLYAYFNLEPLPFHFRFPSLSLDRKPLESGTGFCAMLDPQHCAQDGGRLPEYLYSSSHSGNALEISKPCCGFV